MIDIIIKLDQHTIIITSDGEINYYSYSMEKVMNVYLEPLLLTFDSIYRSSRTILGNSRYKRPIAYYSKQGLNILMPIQSYTHNYGCYVSLNYLLNFTREEFCELTLFEISRYKWSQMISTALSYQRRFDLELDLPECDRKISKELMNAMQKNQKGCNGIK